MTPRIIILTALLSLGANKLRAGLTLLGIVIGVAAFVTLMAIGRGAQQSITSNIESLGSNLLFVTPLPTIDGTSSLTLEDAEALVDPVFAPSVVQVAPEIGSFGFIVAGRVSTGGEILGVTPSYESVRLYSVASGQFISRMHVDNRSTVAVLGSRVSEDLFGLRDPVGQTIRINDRQFTVIGVLESKGGSAFGSQDNQVLTPITTAYYRLSSQRTTQGSITVQTITVQVEDADSMDAAQRQVETILQLRHRITAENDFYVRNQQEIIETLEEATEVFVMFLAAIAGISLLVGGIGIMNIMLVSVTERTREIGIRKAVGRQTPGYTAPVSLRGYHSQHRRRSGGGAPWGRPGPGDGQGYGRRGHSDGRQRRRHSPGVDCFRCHWPVLWHLPRHAGGKASSH